jgi:citrate lyase synthetase
MDAFILAAPEQTPHEEFHSIMRKTVHEWLEANHNGAGLAKKKAARRKSSKRRAISNSQVQQSLTKQQAPENKISRRLK